MFSTAIRAGKAFAVEKKIKELKKSIFTLKIKIYIYINIKKKLKPLEKIRKAVEIMDSLHSKKYEITPKELEQKSLGSEAYIERLNFCHLEKISKQRNRKKEQEKYTIEKPLS